LCAVLPPLPELARLVRASFCLEELPIRPAAELPYKPPSSEGSLSSGATRLFFVYEQRAPIRKGEDYIAHLVQVGHVVAAHSAEALRLGKRFTLHPVVA
jgi:hypothetical protein